LTLVNSKLNAQKLKVLLNVKLVSVALPGLEPSLAKQQDPYCLERSHERSVG